MAKLYKIELYIEDYEEVFNNSQDLITELVNNTKEVDCPAIISSSNIEISNEEIEGLALIEDRKSFCNQLFQNN